MTIFQNVMQGIVKNRRRSLIRQQFLVRSQQARTVGNAWSKQRRCVGCEGNPLPLGLGRAAQGGEGEEVGEEETYWTLPLAAAQA